MCPYVALLLGIALVKHHSQVHQVNNCQDAKCQVGQNCHKRAFPVTENRQNFVKNSQSTPVRTHSISGLKSQVLKLTFLTYDGEKWSRIFYFEIQQAPSELLLPSANKSTQKG